MPTARVALGERLDASVCLTSVVFNLSKRRPRASAWENSWMPTSTTSEHTGRRHTYLELLEQACDHSAFYPPSQIFTKLRPTHQYSASDRQ